MSPWFSNPDLALLIVEKLACVGVIISSLERFAVREQLGDHGLLSWPVTRTRALWLVEGVRARALDQLFRYPRVLGVVGAQLLGALALLACPPDHPARVALCLLVSVTSLLLLLRAPLGNDGADQMSLVVFLTLTLARSTGSGLVMEACLWFLALQACLSYVTAGLVKAVSPRWRDGSALTGIFATATYGAPWLDRLLHRHRPLATWGGRAVILAECAFPLALLLPAPLGLPLLAGGFAFHLMAAGVMGLNTFLWAFVATYPAILYCAGRIG